MIIQDLHRIILMPDYTLGVLDYGVSIPLFTLEDQYQEKGKVKGETCIPTGIHPLRYRQVLSPKTVSYRKKFPWFTWHIEIDEVPGFDFTYVHIGNDDDDTDGCVLLGKTADLKPSNGFIGESTQAYKEWYTRTSALLNSGQEVYMRITN